MYTTEGEKIKDRISKYLAGDVMDIGCGIKKITDDAFGVDQENYSHINFRTTDLYNLPQQLPEHIGKYDVVFSSHCLEHIPNDFDAINQWGEFIKHNGYLILYLPDAKYYDNVANQFHFKSYECVVFTRWFEHFKNFKIIESWQDTGNDRYSFCLIAQKIK